MKPNRLRLFAVPIILLALSACQQKAMQASAHPMIKSDFGEGPWQLVTYEGDKLMHETVKLHGSDVLTQTESVYINKRSQFIYRSGEPIKTFNGESIYWNQAGQIITAKLAVIPEDQIFVVDQKPLPRNTPLRLRFMSAPIDNKMKTF